MRFQSKIQIIFFVLFALITVASAIGSFFNTGLLFTALMGAVMSYATIKFW